MELGFQTCGNATLIAYDRDVPVLVTDPWVEGAQYFGSWRLPYRFEPRRRERSPVPGTSGCRTAIPTTSTSSRSSSSATRCCSCLSTAAAGFHAT